MKNILNKIIQITTVIMVFSIVFVGLSVKVYAGGGDSVDYGTSNYDTFDTGTSNYDTYDTGTSNYDTYTPSSSGTSNYDTYTYTPSSSGTSNYDTYTYTPSYSGTSNYDTYVPTSSYSSGSSCSSCASHGYSYNGGYSTGGGYTYMPQASHYVYIPQRTTSGSTNNTTIVSNNNNNNGNNSNNQLAVNYYNNGVYYPNGYYGNNATNYSAMSGSCVVSYTGSGINTPVTWSATASGGSGSFSYSWTGSDNLYGNGQSITGMYATAGYKTATVTITSTDGQSISRSCNTNVGNINTAGVTVTRDITPTNGTPVAGVFLNQVPATGISFNLKVGLFILGLLMWSAFMTYIFIARKNRKAQLAGNVSTSNSQSLAAQFKIENMKNRGLIA